jgi:signal transduction histidine kinase
MQTSTMARTRRDDIPLEGSAGGGWNLRQQKSESRDAPPDPHEDDLTLSESLQREITERLLLTVLREQDASTRAREASSASLAFLGRVSHELRGPLNVIHGYVDLLVMGVHGPVSARQRIDLDSIREAEKQVLVMINDLLEFLKVQSGQLTYRTKDVSVNDSLTSAVRLMQPSMEKKGLRSHGVTCGRELTVRADLDRTRQILINLLNNAIKFTASGGRIELGCETTDEVVHIHVSDSGVGIPPDRLQDVFIPFVQVGAGRTDSGVGVGLGLAISRDLARGMHGDLTVDSTVGVGSTFTLTLPRH